MAQDIQPQQVTCPACETMVRASRPGTKLPARCPKCGKHMPNWELPAATGPEAMGLGVTTHERYEMWPPFWQGMGMGFLAGVLALAITLVAGLGVLLLAR